MPVSACNKLERTMNLRSIFGLIKLATFTLGALGCLFSASPIRADLGSSAIAAGDASGTTAVVWTRAIDNNAPMPSAQNLLANGSFESPMLATNSYSSVAPTGWAWSGGTVVNGDVWFCCEVTAILAQDGQQYIGIGNPSDTVSQNFAVIFPGQFILTWYDNTGVPPPGPNTSPYSVSVLNSSNQPVLATNFDAGHGGVWQGRAVSMDIAPGTYTLVFTQQGIYGGWGTALDNVSISPFCSNCPPAIVTQPFTLIAFVGGSASFSVAASGTAPLSYQWRKDGGDLADGGNVSGAATASLNLSNVL